MVIEVVVPPLRRRVQDIAALADHLLGFFARQAGNPNLKFTEESREALVRYPWPGNIRELRNAIERGVILCREPLVGLTDLPTQLGTPQVTQGLEVGGRVTLDQLEAEHIRRILATLPTLEEAAEVLGIDPSTLYRKRKRDGL